MARMGKILGTSGLAVAMFVGGGAAAQAYSWGTLSVYDGGLQGQGYGSVSHPSTTSATLHSYLRDLNNQHGRTYAEMQGWGAQTSFVRQSGRRSDGGNVFGHMADATFSSGHSLNGSWVNVRVCQDVSLGSDPCSSWSPAGRL